MRLRVVDLDSDLSRQPLREGAEAEHLVLRLPARIEEALA
jgi:hypothetical protein